MTLFLSYFIRYPGFLPGSWSKLSHPGKGMSCNSLFAETQSQCILFVKELAVPNQSLLAFHNNKDWTLLIVTLDCKPFQSFLLVTQYINPGSLQEKRTLAFNGAFTLTSQARWASSEMLTFQRKILSCQLPWVKGSLGQSPWKHIENQFVFLCTQKYSFLYLPI